MNFDYPKNIAQPIAFPFAFMSDARKRQEFLIELALETSSSDIPKALDFKTLLMIAAKSDDLFALFSQKKVEALRHEIAQKIDGLLHFHKIPVRSDGSHWLHLLWLVVMSEMNGFKICVSNGKQNTDRFRDVNNAILVEWARLTSPKYKNCKSPTITEAIEVARSRMSKNRPISDRALSQSYQSARNMWIIRYARQLEKSNREDAINFLSTYVEHDHSSQF